MSRVRSLAPLLVAAGWLAACATDAAAPPPGSSPEPPFTVTDPTDADQDGIPEQLEDHLMQTFGPELRLPPDEIDWTRPANVDWYLPKVHLRFDHPNCPDDSTNILDVGAITFANIHTQAHFTKSSPVTLCHHNTDPADERFSDKDAQEFFLQAEDDALVHPGIPPTRADEWRVYIQVRPSSYVRASDGKAAAYDLQVWTFYAYNDFFASANHEADWEHTTISIGEDLAVVSVYFATHDNGFRVDDPSALEWSGGTHVVGYVADGSHATYATIGTQPGPPTDDHTYDGGPIWQTWTNAVNLGDRGHVLGGQDWALYGGRWGEVGETSFTSGPNGPLFHHKWDTTTEYPQ